MGETHFVVEEDMSFVHHNRNGGKASSSAVSIEGGIGLGEELIGYESGSPGTSPSEIYQYLANRTSPGGERATRRQRRRKLESQHFVKITDCSPTQGLWKGIYDDMNLGFFLVAYDDIGGISCQKVCDSSGHSCIGVRVMSKHPVFWTTDPTFSKSPFLPEEENLYNSRIYIRPNAAADHIHQGRVWQYSNGTFGFGFLEDSFIRDLKHVAKNGSLLDIM